MQETRDLCWLTKQVKNAGISTYYMEQPPISSVTESIKRELPVLFQGIEPSKQSDASVIFSGSGCTEMGEEEYRIEKSNHGYVVRSSSPQGWLYGMFGLHRLFLIHSGEIFPYEAAPQQSIRMINHWDNVDGTIERGYAGESIYFKDNTFRGDLELIRQYARLLASLGINAVSINNVNVHRQETFFIEEKSLNEIKKVSDVFAAYGVKTFLSINYAAPIAVGNLDTADPLSPEVSAWWADKIAHIYQIIPGFAGFVVKADSEGEPGPFTYGRNHDEGANMLARAIKPFGGLIIWRCFVYNCLQDWRDRTLDRARAAYDIFMELDGKFEDNVILQIKNGPIDFQIREPQSPLFGALRKTNQILEFQITQEYTGHQKDVCYLIPMWKETLDFDTKYDAESIIKTVIKKSSPYDTRSGIAAVGNVGMDKNWTGNKLAQANLYGYGRLVWDNNLSSEEIAREWVQLSFCMEESDERLLTEILTTSRDTYEEYTCPLGIGFMCKPSVHYGADIDGYEYERWGTYHYADRYGVGRDRTKATGTAFTRQYSDERFCEYENLVTCPDELLLFFHHVPYTHILQSGKTLIQHIYDTHFAGVEKVVKYGEMWNHLKNRIDEESYFNVKERLDVQWENAVNWQNQMNTYFYRKSGIADEKGRKIYE